MAHDVFISYSSKDKQVAEAMCNKLESNGIRCWMAPRDILAGMDWGEAIMHAINKCQLMVLVFSSNANASKVIKKEVERAASKGVMVVPFRIEDVQPSISLEFYLSTSHWLDALTPPVEQHLQRLVEDVKELMPMLPEKRVASEDVGMTVAGIEEKIEAELRALRAREVEAAGRIGEEAARRRDEERAQERREAEKLKQAAEEIERRPAVESVPANLTNSVGIEFVWIPPGSFMMGSETYLNEKPAHEVTIKEGFYMGKYVVTQEQWEAVMGNNPSFFKGKNLPVDKVTWDDCIAFIARLNAQKDEYTYRLPSEAEWEYAARAGTTGEYAGYLDEIAWYWKHLGGRSHPVGCKKPNAFGLYDMYGNVWEWCQDWYHDSYAGAPTDGSAWLTGGEQKYHVVRGGSFKHDPIFCRSAIRLKITWIVKCFMSAGFRVVAVSRT
jgi:formylglycine-generating enzyme required for sulfatase activity